MQKRREQVIYQAVLNKLIHTSLITVADQVDYCQIQ